MIEPELIQITEPEEQPEAIISHTPEVDQEFEPVEEPKASSDWTPFWTFDEEPEPEPIAEEEQLEQESNLIEMDGVKEMPDMVHDQQPPIDIQPTAMPELRVEPQPQ